MYNPFAAPMSQTQQQSAMNQWRQMTGHIGNMNPYAIPRNGIKRVSGRAGAEAFPMGPDDQAALFDETGPIVWLVETDSAGYKKTIAPFSLSPYQPETPVDTKALETRLNRVEAWINEQSRAGHAGTGQADAQATSNGPATAAPATEP